MHSRSLDSQKTVTILARFHDSRDLDCPPITNGPLSAGRPVGKGSDRRASVKAGFSGISRTQGGKDDAEVFITGGSRSRSSR